MSTETTLADLIPIWNTVKWSTNATFGIAKGAMWLGQKAFERPQNTSAQLDHDISPLQSQIPQGVVFGKQGKRYITKPETTDGHVLVVGGVGSGKSSCVAIPTLRAWRERAFVIDIKGELYEKTRQYRSNIKVLNPLNSSFFGYDPYFCLYHSSNPVQEARAIAQALIPLPPDIKDPFWIESAQNIFTASILHYSGHGLSFLETIRQLQSLAPTALIAEICTGEA